MILQGCVPVNATLRVVLDPVQMPVVPLIVAVGLGLTITAKVREALVPHEFPAVTVMLPFSPAAPVVTVIELLVAPAVTDQPVGTVQV